MNTFIVNGDLARHNLTIHIIGLGVQQEAVLNSKAQIALLDADCIMGSERQLETVARFTADAQVTILPSLKNLLEVMDDLVKEGVQSLVVLASGDPLFFGIGRWFRQRFHLSQLHFYPAISSIQATCHALGLSLQDVTVVSLHGRPLTNLRRYLQPNRTLVILTDGLSNPLAIAQECQLSGLDLSLLTVCEDLGYLSQRVRSFSVQELIDLPPKEDTESLSKQDNVDFSALNIVVLETSSQISFYPSSIGIEDRKFITDKAQGKGMITKRDVRVAILSYLQTDENDTVWDVGAGCGGVSVELSYWNASAKLYSIEHHPERLTCLHANKERFGVSNMTVVPASAPEGLHELPDPNKVFVGGSDGRLDEVLNISWQRLPSDGILVATAVTENSKRILLDFAERIRSYQGHHNLPHGETMSVQFSIAKEEELSNQRVYRPSLPVTLFKFSKR
ncbi:precorrin-6y C5,15-methyltransferase (decarboxylating) subunit CbiE [Marinomonas sp. 15G1-11]|uniref:Precorrin-6y C5,15-methyltransferase (Decarboxylating) subunit CbiE n=1 Tax=Marinomonas phaeophyticola TaxID=3004091 RepID=A0ABT4JXM0_9GAMM|nr:precorrin-6y C5,15-methyltransferase (decarboxylating) subunit CbiE [Marinomonas sp. 15G1-11]MCZ2723145.1 precorrin-6y C5,15-methyltransferase (decarboxylating) subunit CbiE [Marinomonas sp. 15G1-11]